MDNLTCVATMTLKEITDLLNTRHNDAMAVVGKMIRNKDFGLATKISYPIITGKGKREVINTYQLDKRQSIATAARLNISLLMRVVDRWQELENIARQRQTVEWQQARLEGKKLRRAETDVIKKFVEYAKSQGSKNADKYYMAITKGTYKALYVLEQGGKYEGLRDILLSIDLIQLAASENIVSKYIAEGMELQMPYRDVYKHAMLHLQTYVNLVGTRKISTNGNIIQLLT